MDPNTILKNWNTYTAGQAHTSTDIRPDKIDPKVYGNHCSYVDAGVRIWRFENAHGYFKFITEYSDKLVQPK